MCCRACSSTSPTSPRSRRSAKSEPEKTYLTDCLQTANWLTRSLEQRAQDDPQGRDRDRAAAGRLPGPRRRASAAAEPADRRRRDRHARIHRFARDVEQVCRHAPRHLRDEVLLHRRDLRDARRRRAFGRGGAPPHQADDRRGKPRGRTFRRRDRPEAARFRDRHRTAYSGQVSGRIANSVLRRTPARKAGDEDAPSLSGR